MMGKVWRLLLLALLLNTVLATMALARPVYLADGGIIQAQKVWQEEGRIYVLLNRDSLIHFSPEEINLKKTFAKKWKDAPLKSGKKSVIKGVVTASAAPAPPVVAVEVKSPAAKPAVAVPAAKSPTAAQVNTPTPAPAPVAVSVPVPAKTTPPPPAVAKPAPAPRPAAAPVSAAEAPEMLGLVFLGAGLLFVLLLIASFWKVFEKAGEAGWKSLIPIYNLFVLLRIAGCPGWWFLMFFLPVLNIYFVVVMHIRLAERFGKGALYGFALCFLGFIFFPLLAFGSATYEGEESFTFD